MDRIIQQAFEEVLEPPETIPGVGRRTAEPIVVETGTEMNRFHSADHLCSWAGVRNKKL